MKKCSHAIVVVLLLFVGFVCMYQQTPIRDNFSMVSGYRYQDGCDKLPVPENIREVSRSGPFYDLNAIRPPLCSYKNYIFPPPLEYPPLEQDCSDFNKRYRYWNTGVLSHPWTTYLV